jgi:ferric-dicitrate binding protein FerR (iron transport regulator)
MCADDLETRLQQLLDGDLPPDEWPELRELLRSSEGARRIYAEHSRLHAALSQIGSGRKSLRRPLAPVSSMPVRQRRLQRPLAALATAAAVALAALVLHVVWNVRRGGPIELAAAPGSKFSIVPPGNSLAPGSTLRLERGVVELEFGSGSRSVLRAPAEISIDSASAWSLARGIAWFHVSPKDAGFRVSAPRVEVTDLGTEFGVIAGGESEQAVQLFQGTLQVRSRVGAREEITLRGSGAREISSRGRFEPSALRRDRFFTALPAQLPWIGWDFDAATPADWKVSGTMPEADSVRGKAMPTPDSVSAAPGRFGNALHIRGDGGWWKTNWPGIAGDAPRTLAFRVRLSERGDYIHPIAGWGLRYDPDDPTLGSFFSFVETVDGRSVAGASVGGYWIKGVSPIADDRWHHIAVTSSGGHAPDGAPDLHLFVDGRPEPVVEFHSPEIRYSARAPLALATDVTDPRSQPLSVFAQLLDDGSAGHPFPGSLDGLRVVESVLSAEEIRLLAETDRLPKYPISMPSK